MSCLAEGLIHTSPNPILVQLVSKRATRQAHAARRFRLRSPGRGESANDQFLLRSLQQGSQVEGFIIRRSCTRRQISMSISRGCDRLRDWKVFGGDFGSVAQNV